MDRHGQPFAHHPPFLPAPIHQQQQQQHHQQQQPFGQQASHVQAAAQQFPPGSGHIGLQFPPAAAFGFGFHPPPYPFMPPAPPPSQGFFNPWEPPPMPVPPPADAELQKRIDKLVEYAAKNGPQFEALMKEKQKDNPAYSFLIGAEGHNYYRYKLWVIINTHMGSFNAPAQSMNPTFSSLNPPLHLPNPSLASALISAPTPPTANFAPLYEQQTHAPPPPPPIFEQKPSKVAYDDQSSQPPKAFRGSLPADVATELQGVLDNLTGTKESIKGAKTWFMQRLGFAPALADSMRARVVATDDVERQLHIIYLVNDILFNSLQQRSNPKELDNEALAFQPALGPMLAAVYHNPHAAEANRSRLEKILQFWGSNAVYEIDTINTLEGEMVAGPPPPPPSQFQASLQPSASVSALVPIPLPASSQVEAAYPGHWKPDQQMPASVQQQDGKHQPSFGGLPTAPQFLPTGTQFNLSAPQLIASSVPTLYPALGPPFLTSLPTSVPAVIQQPSLAQLPTIRAVEHSPYPLFPPGLIPGMVRKMQIGSGVPYSSLSPLDIPTVIPPSTSTESHILERVTKFFKEIGEIDPLESQNKGADSREGEDGDQEEHREGGARIPPPQMLLDPDTGTLPDGSVELRPGATSTGRLGLGAAADPNEVTQYDDVYTSYRKQRSTNYHTSLSARAAAR